MRILSLFFLILLITACEITPTPVEKPLKLEPAHFSQLPGWEKENFKKFSGAMQASCARIVKHTGSNNDFATFSEAGTFAQWAKLCRDFSKVNHKDRIEMRIFFETYFRPYVATAGGDEEGLFTGYYEASLKGSRVKTEIYDIPLYARPDDLVMVDLGQFRDHLKGERIAGRVTSGKLKPYEDRAQIVKGAWPHSDKVLVWVDDAVDAFFVQIQGSGVIELNDGSVMRVGYAGQNGHPYYAIGRELIKRGHIEKDNVSLQSIRTWLYANPDQAAEIMNTNRSYVFFQENKKGATGGSGVELTGGRSLAIDHSIIPYGLPVWLDIEPPIEGAGRFQKLMMTQDTGGAIRGPVRGDVFWGYGDIAEKLAGAMKSQGRYWLLLPR